MAEPTTPTAADQTQGQPGNAAALPANQPASEWERLAKQYQKEAEEWQKRAQGWQGKYQETDNAKKTAEGQVLDLQGKLLDAETSAKSKGDAAAKLATDLAAKTTEAETSKAQLDRQTLIAKEFPDLMDLELAGALPGANGDSLRAALKALDGKIKAKASGQVNDALNGASVTPPPAEKQKSAEELKKMWITAVQQGKTQAEVDKAADAYYAATKEDGK